MKEIRPSTWITLAILALLIFVPAFFIDVDTLTPPNNGEQFDNSIKPIDPNAKPKPAVKPENKPDKPPVNKPESNDPPAVD